MRGVAGDDHTQPRMLGARVGRGWDLRKVEVCVTRQELTGVRIPGFPYLRTGPTAVVARAEKRGSPVTPTSTSGGLT